MWITYKGVIAPLVNRRESFTEEDVASIREELEGLGLRANYDCTLIYETCYRDERYDIEYDDKADAFLGADGNNCDQYVEFSGPLPPDSTATDLVVFKRSVDKPRARTVLKKHGLEVNLAQIRNFTALHYDRIDSPVDLVDIKTFSSAKVGERYCEG